MHLRKRYGNFLISLPVQRPEKRSREGHKALRMNTTALYPGEIVSLDRETIKKKMGDTLKVHLCVTKDNGKTDWDNISSAL